ncbi:MAG: formate dehydrogenase [Chloroflexota bacterium]
MESILNVENGNTLETIRHFLKRLLDEGIVDLLLLPMRTPSGTVTPALVSNSALLESADPLAPVLPSNAATLAGKVSVRPPRGRVGVVLRACEMRALIELTKMQQASLDDLILISVDCLGTYNVPTYLRKESGAAEPLWKELLKSARQKPEMPDEALRAACRVCEQPVFDKGHLRIKLLESEWEQEVRIAVADEIAEKLGLNRAEGAADGKTVEVLVAARTQSRDAAFEEIRGRLEGEEGIAGVFAACIRCHNCMTVCPICYCKTCVFKSAVFEHEPMQYVEWAKQKGAYRLPADTMLFHLTRLNHMGLSCVGCGMCTEACPAELPVGMVFRAIGQRLQATFEYLPGRDVAEPLPLVTFKADEWTEVGE